MNQLVNTTSSNCPLLCIGDWNKLFHPAKKQRGNPYSLSQIATFRDAINFLQLSDIGYQSFPFSWKRGHGSNQTLECLDRGLASTSWRQLFSKVVFWHLPFIKSNYCPLLLTTQMRRYMKDGGCHCKVSKPNGNL